MDDYGEDTIDEGDTDMLNHNERASLADEQDIVANEQDIPFYNQTEMDRIGAYHVEQILRGNIGKAGAFTRAGKAMAQARALGNQFVHSCMMMES